MEVDTATTIASVVTETGNDGGVVDDPSSLTNVPVISDSVTPSTILLDDKLILKDGSIENSDTIDHQPPLKKIKLEYEPEEEGTEVHFADAIVTTTAAVTAAVEYDDTTHKKDSTLEESVSVSAEVMNSQSQPVDSTRLVVTAPSSSVPQIQTATEPPDANHQPHVDDEENEDLFGTVGGHELNERNETTDVLEGTAAPMATVPTGEAPTSSHEVVNDKQVPESTEVSESVSAIGDDSTTTPVKATSEFSIPRKSSHTKVTTTAGTAAAVGHNKQSYTSGTRYGLPVGVNVPVSIVQSKLLEVEMNTPGSKLMDVLKSLPVNLINDALTEYDDAVDIKGANSIRNHGAYLYGVVKRYVSVRERSLNGETVSGHNPMGDDGLTPAVQSRLDQLVTSGFCSHQEMNDKVKSKIRMLSEKDAMCALDDLSSVERTQIRNFGSYLMGILNRYMRGEPSAKKSSMSSSNQHHPNGSNYNSNHTPSNHRHPPNHHREPSNRFAPPLHNPSLSSSSFSSSYPPNSRKNNNNFRSDNRGGHQGGQQQQQQRPPFRMDQNNNNQHSFDGHRPQQPGTHLVPSWQQNQPTPPNQFLGGQGNMPNAMGPPSMNNLTNTNIPGMPPTNFNFPGQPQQMQQYSPPMQPSSYMPQPLQQQSYGQPSSYSMPNTMQPQAALPPNTTGMYQPQPNGMMGQQQSQPPFQGNPSYQQQTPPMMNQSSAQFVPNHMSSQAPPGSIDILGLADKAASAIQALGATNKLNQGQAVYPPHQQHMQPQQQQQQQQGYHPQPQPYNSGSGLNQSSQMNVPTSSRPGQPMFHQNQMYPQQQPQHPPAFGGPNNMNPPPSQQQQQQGARRRTTASFHELPMSVQYALQNLIATGAIDGQPDDGILGMIMDLPEQMALVGLQKFAAVDKSTMRNRFAYLAGVLRRELEGIHRR